MVRLIDPVKYADIFNSRFGCQISGKIGYPNLSLKIANNIYMQEGAWGNLGSL